MANFYIEQFSKMFTPQSFVIWLLTILCFILDLLLIKKGSISYLNKSISLFNIPEKYKYLNLEKLKIIPEFEIKPGDENNLFLVPKYFLHFHVFPILTFKVNTTQTIEGKVQISILKAISFVFAIFFFYLVLSGEWGKGFEKVFGTFMGLPKVFYFLVLGILVHTAYGSWAALSILKDARSEK